jgi:xylulokinase
MVMYGSSVFFILKTDRLHNSPAFWGTRFLEPGAYAVAGGMSTAGSLTRWFRDQLGATEVAAEAAGGENAYAALAQLAAQSPIGANGLMALPYFAGERTPIFDPDARGLLLGLTLSHTRGDIYRALLESVGYGIRHNLDALRAEGITPRRILAVGGGTRNRLWMQIVSDVGNIEQHIPVQQIGAAYGDAFLAGIGVGLFANTGEVGRWVRTQEVVRPDPAAHATYGEFYTLYRQVYRATADVMHRLTQLAAGP